MKRLILTALLLAPFGASRLTQAEEKTFDLRSTNIVALPHLEHLPLKGKAEDHSNYTEARAQDYCMTKMCGEQKCTTAVKYETQPSPPNKNVKRQILIQVFDKNQVAIGRAQDISTISNENLARKYYTSITCTDRPREVKTKDVNLWTELHRLDPNYLSLQMKEVLEGPAVNTCTWNYDATRTHYQESLDQLRNLMDEQIVKNKNCDPIRWLTQVKKEIVPVVSSGALAVTVSPFLGQGIVTSLTNVYHKWLDCEKTPEDGMKWIHEAIKKDTAPFMEARVKRFGKEFADGINLIDVQITAAIAQKQVDAALKSLTRRIQLFALPTESKDVSLNSQKSRLIDAALETLIAEQEPKNRELLENIIDEFRAASHPSVAHGLKPQLYLYGPRGTGKTHFVNQMAQALGVPICILDLNQIEGNELLGADHPMVPGLPNNEMAKLANCMIESGVTDPIIYFTEATNSVGADKPSGPFGGGDPMGGMKKAQMLGVLKRVLDPKNLKLLFKNIGIHLDFSKAMFVMDGNHDLHEDLDEGDRVRQINFSKMIKETKLKSMNNLFKEVMDVLGQNLSPEDSRRIEVTMRAQFPLIVERDEEVGTPGVRFMEQAIKDATFFYARLLRRQNAGSLNAVQMGDKLIENKTPEELVVLFIQEKFDEKIRKNKDKEAKAKAQAEQAGRMFGGGPGAGGPAGGAAGGPPSGEQGNGPQGAQNQGPPTIEPPPPKK